jgi:hypothetical protein
VGCGKIARRWMLGELVRCVPDIVLNSAGKELLAGEEPTAGINPSWHAGWWFAEHIPRREIFNDGVWPVKRTAIGSDGARHPEKLPRDGKVWYHSTAEVPPGLETCHRVETYAP